MSAANAELTSNFASPRHRTWRHL